MMPRNYRAVLLEAELLASSPERVFDRLTALALESTEAAADLDLRTQVLLLQRQHPLIDLALASTSGELTVAAAIFRRAPPATTAPVSPDQEQPETDSPLRLAVLGNRKVFAAPFGRESLKSVIGMAVDQWYPTATINELQALVANDSISDDVLLPLVSAPAVDGKLDDLRRQHAVVALSQSARGGEWTKFGPDDGHVAHERLLLQERCWELAEWVPTTREWALVLGLLLGRWPTVQMSERDPANSWLEVARRWESSDFDGYIVRTQLARLQIFQQPSDTARLLAHADPAVRDGAYMFGALTPEQALAASQTDPVNAYNALVMNEHLWQTQEGRDALKQAERTALANDKDWRVYKRYNDEAIKRYSVEESADYGDRPHRLRTL